MRKLSLGDALVVLKVRKNTARKKCRPSIDEKWTASLCILSKEGSADRPSVKVFETRQPASKCTKRGENPPRGTPARHRRGRKDPSGLSMIAQGVRHLISLSLTGRYSSVLRFLTLFYLHTRGKTLLLGLVSSRAASEEETKLVTISLQPESGCIAVRICVRTRV